MAVPNEQKKDEPKNQNPAPVKTREEYRIVLADGTALPAEVTKKHKGDLVDVRFDHKGVETQIMQCPHDPDGKRPDSWHAAQVPV